VPQPSCTHEQHSRRRSPLSSSAEGFVRLYRFTQGGLGLELLHSTPLGGVIPAALAPFAGRLLVGAGRALRLMELGRKKLLRKCEFSELPSFVATLHTMGERIYVGDAQESFQWLKYRRAENAFYVFADDCVPRCGAGRGARGRAFRSQWRRV